MLALVDGSGRAEVSRARAVGGLVAGGAAVAAATVVVHLTGGQLAFAACPFHAVTGLSCPFCGGLRAVSALSDADLPAALSHNVAAVLIVGCLALHWAAQVVVALRGGRPRMPALSQRTLLVVGVVLLVFTVWRNVPALPLADFLAP